jgi:hypothetical protein
MLATKATTVVTHFELTSITSPVATLPIAPATLKAN